MLSSKTVRSLRAAPVLVCGDFNDVPSSPVVLHFKATDAAAASESSKSATESNASDRKAESPDDSAADKLAPSSQAERDSQARSHNFDIGSLYDDCYPEPSALFTTYKKRDKEVCRTIDYIWFSRQVHSAHPLLAAQHLL